jgi:hypothetical protein
MRPEETRAALPPDDQVQPRPDPQPRQGEAQHEQPLTQPTVAAYSQDELLQREILLALQPALTGIQEQMAQRVQQQLNEALHLQSAGTHEGRAEANREPAAPEPSPAAQAAERATTETPEGNPEAVTPATGQTRMRGLLYTASETLKQEGEQSLRRVLDIALDALFADSMRIATQRRMEHALRSSLQSSLDVVPNAAVRRELQQQVETTLQPMLREAIDAIFAADVRTEVQPRLESVINAPLKGDFELARLEMEQAARVLGRQVIPVVQRHGRRIPRLLLKVTLSALEDAVASIDKKETLRDSTRSEPQASRPA